MMYFIVEFGDNTIAMVPENWLNKDKTMTKWPPYKDDKKIVLAIDKMELPTSEWGSFDISRIISTAGKLIYLFICGLFLLKVVIY